MLSYVDTSENAELQMEAAEARQLADLLENDAAIADLIAYASMLEAAPPPQ